MTVNALLNRTGSLLTIPLSAYATASALAAVVLDSTTLRATITTNTGNLTINATSLAGKQDSLTACAPFSLSGSTLSNDTSSLQPLLGTGNPNIGVHVKLINNNSSLALVASGGLTATDQGSYVELSGATLQTDIAAKADTTYVNTQLGLKAATLIDNMGVGVPVLVAPCSSAISRITATANGPISVFNNLQANVELDTTDVLSKSAGVAPIQAVVENPGTRFYYLRTPATSSLAVSNGANHGAVAAFNYDGSSVLHGPVTANQSLTVPQNLTVSGNITTTAFPTALSQAANAQQVFTAVSPLSMTFDANSGQFKFEADLSTKQGQLNLGNDVTLNVGRGGVMLEDNSNDNTYGNGVTLRPLTNPTNGSIFAVRSSGQSCRLWVGQGIATSGINEFLAGYTATSGSERIASNYKHSLTSALARFGTPVEVTGDLTVSGTVTAASLAGGAATAMTSELATAKARQQDALTANRGCGNNVLNAALSARKLENIFEAGAVQAFAIYDPGNADHGNLQI